MKMHQSDLKGAYVAYYINSTHNLNADVDDLRKKVLFLEAKLKRQEARCE